MAERNICASDVPNVMCVLCRLNLKCRYFYLCGKMDALENMGYTSIHYPVRSTGTGRRMKELDVVDVDKKICQIE